MPSTEDPNPAECVAIKEDTDEPGHAALQNDPNPKNNPDSTSAEPNQTGPEANTVATTGKATISADQAAKEYGGPAGLEPTRYGDWEKNGRCTDF
jgi:hypothetical protein